MFKTVYEAQHSIEAHMLVHLLEQSGLNAVIQGEYLQGGIGDLPTMGLVRVSVDEADFDKAVAVIQDWEQSQPPIDKQVQEKKCYPLLAFFSGAIVGALFVWSICSQTNTPS